MFRSPSLREEAPAELEGHEHEQVAPDIEAAGLAVINWAAKANDWGWVVKLNGRTK